MYVRGYVVYVQIKSINNVNSISAYGAADTEQHTLFTYVMLSKMAPGWRGGDELLNKVIIFAFFAYFS